MVGATGPVLLGGWSTTCAELAIILDVDLNAEFPRRVNSTELCETNEDRREADLELWTRRDSSAELLGVKTEAFRVGLEEMEIENGLAVEAMDSGGGLGWVEIEERLVILCLVLVW